MSISKSNPLTTLPSFVNLSDPETLQDHVDPKYQKFITSLLPIARGVYESTPRVIEGAWGLSFPINSEILSYCMKKMQRIQNGIAVEVAAAKGENALLLASASKTSKVYINEILSTELQQCRSLTGTLPKPIQKQLILSEGSCLDLLQKHPELTGKVDLFLSRNLIHFFKDKEQSNLAQDTKKMLKPGGQAIFSTNAIYPIYRENPNIFENNLTTTCISVYQCLFSKVNSSTPDIIYRKSKALPSNSYSSDYDTKYIYERDPFNKGKWKVNTPEFQQLDSEIRSDLIALFKKPDIKEVMKSKEYIKVQVVTTSGRMYNEQTLSAIFVRQGFNVVNTYVTNSKGHLIADKDKFTDGCHVGVIVEKPEIPTGIGFKIKKEISKVMKTPSSKKTCC